MTDVRGITLRVGDRVARAYRTSTQAHLELRTVSRIDGDKVYLDSSHVPVTRTDNLVILERVSADASRS